MAGRHITTGRAGGLQCGGRRRGRRRRPTGERDGSTGRESEDRSDERGRQRDCRCAHGRPDRDQARTLAAPLLRAAGKAGFSWLRRDRGFSVVSSLEDERSSILSPSSDLSARGLGCGAGVGGGRRAGSDAQFRARLRVPVLCEELGVLDRVEPERRTPRGGHSLCRRFDVLCQPEHRSGDASCRLSVSR
jgi:hypothetical protein